jgi:hypothetical protein
VVHIKMPTDPTFLNEFVSAAQLHVFRVECRKSEGHEE